MKFHISDDGQIRQCAAESRPCPFGPHYDSQADAARSVMRAEDRRTGFLMPFGKYLDQPLEAVVRDDSYTKWLLNKSDLRRTDPDLHRRIREASRLDALRNDFRRM